MMRSAAIYLLALVISHLAVGAAGEELRLSIASEGEWVQYWGRAKDQSSSTDDEPKPTFFYLVLSSESVAIAMTANTSDWWRALSFTIILEDGRTYFVSRPPRNWARNPSETWMIGKGRCRVWVVNFQTGNWDGLPKQNELTDGKPMKLQAFFRLKNQEKEWKAQSEPVEMRP